MPSSAYSGYPTPDAPAAIVMTTRCVTIPDIPAFVALISGLLYQATRVSFWVQDGDMTRQECADLMADALALYDASTEGECAVVDGTPVGSVVWFPSAAIPAKWLLCDGTTYAQDDYPELYDVLTAFQNGTDFTVPDLIDRYLYGVFDQNDIGTEIGVHNGEINENNLPPHTHTIPAHTHTAIAATGVGILSNRLVQGTNAGTINSTAISTAPATVTGSVGTGDPFENRPLSVQGNWIIKALP